MGAEDRFVELLRASLRSDESLLLGPGDDAAVIDRAAGPLVASTDTLVEGVDFLPGEDPKRLGRRAVSVGLSGLAAVGARAGAEPPRGEAAWTPESLSPADETALLAAYRDPEPRLPLGRALASEGLATAAIDVSDGLGVDAGRLARASGVRLVIEVESLPLSPALLSFARLAGRDPVEMALAGGDDYELLFTVPASESE